MFGEFFALFQQDLFISILHAAKVSAPLWVPALFFVVWLELHIKAVRREWILKQGSVLLELRFPREVPRSPAAMELVLHGLWEDVVDNMVSVFFEGQVRDWFSLEIVSIGGQVKFFIWCLPNWKTVVESRIYAQFPGIEVHEVSDYTKGMHFDPKTMKMFAMQTAKVKPSVFPIRTYKDYELEKMGNEDEEKVDPLTPLIEWMGSLGPGENCWVQLMIQAHRGEKIHTDLTFNPKPHWKDEVDAAVKDILGKALFKPGAGETRKPSSLDLSKIQQEAIEAIQRSQDKLSYDAMMRCLYFAPKENYRSVGGKALVGSMRQFGSRNLNGIKPIFGGFVYDFQDFGTAKKRRYQQMIFDAYKRRSTFNGLYKNWNAKPYVLNVEEIATLFHFPGQLLATTPTLSRIPSKKAEAPSNLPV